jgi:hypothetical protein
MSAGILSSITITHGENSVMLLPGTDLVGLRPPEQGVLPRMLKMLLTGRSLLFLGCSLNQDRTVQVLERVVAESREIGHYAILELPLTVGKRREKTKFMDQHNIRPIWYPNGKHTYIRDVLQTLILESMEGRPTMSRRLG